MPGLVSMRVLFNIRLAKTNMNIVQINRIEDVIKLLKECSLPISDLKVGDDCFFYGIYDGSRLISCIGVELFGDVALLRSLAVSSSEQRKGKGRVLVEYVECFCKSMGVKSIYLLTSTASLYFSTLGYKPVARSIVPDVIKASTQYSSVCPDSATIMRINVPHG